MYNVQISMCTRSRLPSFLPSLQPPAAALGLAILAALDQRISTRYTITGMSFADTADYISHHLKFAGRSDTLFSDDAITAIHQASRGYPRAVNNLAVSSLIATYAADKAIVDLSATQSAITENSE